MMCIRNSNIREFNYQYKTIYSMKKIFTLSCILATALSANAQSAFKVSPDFLDAGDGTGSELLLLGEKLSTNNRYVSGQDQNSQVPFVWNVETDEIKALVITDDVRYPIDWDEDGNETDWETMTMTRSGSFRSVSPDGIAVGSVTDQETYISYPVMYNAVTGEHTYLFAEGGEAGGEGYGITDDSKTIVGFYFDESWNATACIWTNEGQNRAILPPPSEDETGFPIDYASARWITPDGRTVLGYVQDFYSGQWVAILWNLQEDGSYSVDASLARQLYQPRPYTEVEGPDGWPMVIYDEIEDPKPYTQIEPLCISDNGEWMMAVIADYVDEDNDQNFFNAGKSMRYNLKTGQCDIVEAGDETAMIELFGIANDGTAVGRYTGPFDMETWSQAVDAVVWPVGAESFVKLADYFAEDPYVEGWASSALSSISANGKTAMGYASDEFGLQTSFVVDLPDLSEGVNRVNAATSAEVIYDLQGRRVENAAKGLYIVNGTKVIR